MFVRENSRFWSKWGEAFEKRTTHLYPIGINPHLPPPPPSLTDFDQNPEV